MQVKAYGCSDIDGRRGAPRIVIRQAALDPGLKARRQSGLPDSSYSVEDERVVASGTSVVLFVKESPESSQRGFE
jgi:hypothetical protein